MRYGGEHRLHEIIGMVGRSVTPGPPGFSLISEVSNEVAPTFFTKAAISPLRAYQTPELQNDQGYTSTDQWRAAAEFLLSLHDAQPDFNLIGLPEAANLPAVRWKLINLRKLMAQNSQKHADLRGRLNAALGR